MLEQEKKAETINNTAECINSAPERDIWSKQYGYLKTADTIAVDAATMENIIRNGHCSEMSLFASAFGLLLAEYNSADTAMLQIIDTHIQTDQKQVTTRTFTVTNHMQGDVLTFLAEQERQMQEQKFSKMTGDEHVVFLYIEDEKDTINQHAISLKAELCMRIQKQKDNHYHLSVFYRKDMYSYEFIDSLLHAYIQTVNQILSVQKLEDISFLDEIEKKKLYDMNCTEVAYDRTHSVVKQFRDAAQRFPAHDAVITPATTICYSKLNILTDSIAGHLQQAGFCKGDVAGILVPRNEYMVLCSLAVLKAGGTYLPLDASYPSERLTYMLQDAQASILLTVPELKDIVSEFDKTVLLVSDIKDKMCELMPVERTAHDDLFVILYTSGTTGKPKGVMVTDGNVNALCAFTHNLYNMDAGSVSGQYASFGFDAFLMDAYPTLTIGAALCIVPEDMRLDLHEVFDYYKEHKVTQAIFTTQIARQFAALGNTGYLKGILTGGEKLATMNPPDYPFYNAYGPSEATVMVSYFQVDRVYEDIPIGKPIQNIKFYIVDKAGRRLPAGAVGELWVCGHQVSAGYLNNPDKTAQAYMDNPFTSEAGYERIYKTGDLVRFLPDGNVQFIGRRDKQVKIRGFRIELSEVEEVIRRYKGVEDAVVADFDSASGGKYLAAYIVSSNPIDTADLKAFISREKPSYMVPAVFMQINQIPYTQNHKVNKQALPEPVYQTGKHLVTENETQGKIAQCAEQILGHTDFDIDTSLMDAGMTSISLIQFASALGEAFACIVRIGDIMEHDTIRKLEEFLSHTQTVQTHEIQSDYPLTQTQLGIFIDSNNSKESTAYNIPIYIKLHRRVDMEQLEEALKTAVKAHPYILATLFANEKGEIRAKRDDNRPVEINHLTESTLPEPDRLVVPYHMLESPLYRLFIYHTPEGNVLFMDFHHIIADGTAVAVLLEDISRAYAGEPVQKETYTAYELALDEELLRGSEKYQKAKAYYEEHFTGCETNGLPVKAPESSDAVPVRYQKILSTSKAEAEAYCKKHGISLNAFFNAVFGYTLGHFLTTDSYTYTTVYNGRNDSRVMSMFGMLVKSLPMLVDGCDDMEVSVFLENIQKMLLGNMEHDIFSYAEAVSEFGLHTDALFAYQGDDFEFKTLCGYPADIFEIPEKTAKAPIVVTAFAKEEKFVCDTEYRPDMFSRDFMENFMDTMDTIASEFLKKTRLSEVLLISDKQRTLINKVNETQYQFINLPAQYIFESYVAKQPEKPAIWCNGQQMTYQELKTASDKIADGLVRRGVQMNEIVGILLDRSVDIVAAEFGIMKVGGAFLGMLPSYPNERMNYCLEDAESHFVITTEEILHSKAELFTEDKPYRAVTLEELYQETLSEPRLWMSVPWSVKNHAYCIYTSGTTGKPKGVLVNHIGLANLAQQNGSTLGLYYGNEGGTVSLAMSSISFDMSLFENLLFLLNGKSVVMATEEEIHNPGALAQLIKTHGVDTLSATPSLLMNYVDIPEFAEALHGIRRFLVGAEAFPAQLLDKLRATAPDARILNAYGPSECTICSSAKEITDASDITIGHPNKNTKYLVYDKQGRILPPYGCGELIIGGICVGGGYIHLPEKTKASFFSINHIPAYHSGDVARMTGNGEIQCLGRMDDQVKLRGFRIELGEIEKAISSFGGIRSCKVIVRNNNMTDYLAGFFTAESQIDTEKLQEHLRANLNYYMVPDVLMQLDKIPLTPNGKLDVKALPETVKPNRGKKERKVRRETLEDTIIQVFAEVLSDDSVSYDDNFFELGGTSLAASRVVMQLLSKGYDIEYQNIFDNPTPEELAEYLNEKKRKQEVQKSEAKHTQTEYQSEFEDVLLHNTLANVDHVTRQPLGDVLLTGGVGFLGIHVLRELMERKEGQIICLVRGKSGTSPERRLRMMLMYYFGQMFENILADRVTIVDADITDEVLADKLKDYHVDTIINCAAIVKHFAADDSIEHVNTHGVEILIDYAKQINARLIQISTGSIPGVHTEETYRRHLTMHENELFLIDSLDNKYLLSKYHAEQKMFQAIREGLDGKVIRVGNLMGRYTDGEFQVNMNTNAFLSALKGFSAIGKFPLGHATDTVSLSPIDLTAQAIVLLAGTDRKFTAFHADNRNSFDEMQIITACNRCHVPIASVDDESFGNAYQEFLASKDKNGLISGLITTERPDCHMVEIDNSFTANVLYRLGFAWSLTDTGYLDKVIQALRTMDFFE